ncbi:MAG: DUF92 domain-containing protein [Thermoanaerobaculia bacterium]
MKLSPAEWKRKAVHAGMGLFALALRWLSWEQAALCALAALLFNLFVMPRIGRGIYRDGSRRRDAGIVAYPAMVLLLLLLFRGASLPIAAAVWAMMAFGDPAAAIVGKIVEGPRLPWNREKTWMGLLANWAFGAAAAAFVFWFVAARLDPEAAAILTLGAGLFAFLESVRSGIDDNLVAALPTAFFLAWVSLAHPPAALPGRPGVFLALAINAAVAVAAYLAGAVSVSGAVAGALVGTAVLSTGGSSAYAVLWCFFLAGTLASKLGYRAKEKLGTAQARQGRRGAEHVAANCLVGTLIALLSSFQALWGLAFAACFAAAAADTLATEFGSLYGRRAFSPLGGARLPVGTPGAVSWAGLAAAAAGAASIGLAASLAGLVPSASIWIVAVAGFAGALAESATNDLGRRFSFRLDHEFANALNTFVGAVVAIEIGASLAKGSLYLPVEG